MRILHLLNWKFTSIENILEQIKVQGFDAVQINPVQPFKHDSLFHWWLSYQPLKFEIGNMFGNKEDLIHLCRRAKEKGLDIIVDVVINHTANKSNDLPLEPHETIDDELLNNKKC